jgi:aldose sugar dehydrogenase
MFRALLAAALLLALTPLMAVTGDGDAPGDWAVDPAVTVAAWRLGLNFPLGLNFLDDGRVVYGEWQTGKVQSIAPGNGAITTLVDLDVLTGGEMGLHEVSVRTLDGTTWVYVSYTHGQDSFWGCVLCRARLSRFAEVAPDVLGPEQVLLDLPGGFVHNGGIIAWGPLDGMLYYSRGDISWAHLSQQPDGWSGRILRLTPEGAIPPDNPFGATNPTYALGLRHTFGIDFLPGTSLLLGTENGPERNDEVNLLLPGQNYGWPMFTGFEAPTGGDHADPLRAFARTIGPTNRHVYVGNRIPHWTGQFFYGDTNNGNLYRLVPQATTNPARAPELVVDTPPFLIIDVATGADGYLYFSRPEGIYRVQLAEDVPEAPGLRLPAGLPS